ncbi:MAG: hypothetical protein JWR44_2427 [Hymenobacter sp.]|nr:hypothetical protein [Hymenobacter sp.]
MTFLGEEFEATSCLFPEKRLRIDGFALLLSAMIQLIPFRLHGTIPAATGRELAAELRQVHEANTGPRRAQKQFFARFQEWPYVNVKYGVNPAPYLAR